MAVRGQRQQDVYNIYAGLEGFNPEGPRQKAVDTLAGIERRQANMAEAGEIYKERNRAAQMSARGRAMAGAMAPRQSYAAAGILSGGQFRGSASAQLRP